MTEEATQKDLDQFRKWKERQFDPDSELGRQEDLRTFREEYGVDKASPFTCPFCTGWGGRLYFNDIRNLHICRTCKLVMEINFMNKDLLKRLLDERKARRAEKRQDRRDRKGQVGAKPGHEDISPEMLEHLRSISLGETHLEL